MKRGIAIVGLVSGLAEAAGAFLAVQTHGWTFLTGFLVIVGVGMTLLSAYWLVD